MTEPKEEGSSQIQADNDEQIIVKVIGPVCIGFMGLLIEFNG